MDEQLLKNFLSIGDDPLVSARVEIIDFSNNPYSAQLQSPGTSENKSLVDSLREGANKAQMKWVEDELSKNQIQTHTHSIGMNIDGPNTSIMDKEAIKKILEENYKILLDELYSKGIQITSESNLYDYPSKSNQTNFPEIQGPELKHIPADDGKPHQLIFDDAGILSRIDELTQKKAGGVEPPAFITAKEMADEIESLPRSLVEVALDPQDTGEADIFLEELKRQGEGFAVAINIKDPLQNLQNLFEKMWPKMPNDKMMLPGTPGLTSFKLEMIDLTNPSHVPLDGFNTTSSY